MTVSVCSPKVIRLPGTDLDKDERGSFPSLSLLTNLLNGRLTRLLTMKMMFLLPKISFQFKSYRNRKLTIYAEKFIPVMEQQFINCAIK